MTRALLMLLALFLAVPAAALAEPLRLGGVPLMQAMADPATAPRLDARVPAPGKRAVRASAQAGDSSEPKSSSKKKYILFGAIGGTVGLACALKCGGDGYKPPREPNIPAPPR